MLLIRTETTIRSALVFIALSVLTVVLPRLAVGAAAEAAGEAGAEGRGIRPAFSVRGGVYADKVVVALSSPRSSGVIRFTTDGTLPEAGSAIYTSPIAVTNPAVICARLFEGDKAVGAVERQTYLLLHPELAGFDSNLPLVFLHTFGREILKEEKIPAHSRWVDSRGGRASGLGAADFEGRMLINIRGRASLRYPKHSYTIKSVDDADEPRKAGLLGLPADADWVLYAPYPDKTLMRDVLGYELSNEIGRMAPRTRFVEVFLRENPGRIDRGDYLGVYVLVERIKRGQHRVDIEKLGPEDITEPAVSGGYIFKKDHDDRGGFGPMMFGGYPAFQAAPVWNRLGYPTGPGGFPGSAGGFQPSSKVSSRTSMSGSTTASSRPSRSSLQLTVTNQLGSPRQVAGTGRGRVRATAQPGLGMEEELVRDPAREMMEPEYYRESFRSLRTNLFFYVEPEPDELTAVQRGWLKGYVNRCEKALYGPDFKDRERGYAAYLDPDSFIDHHLLVEVTKNVDGFRFSTFFHKDRGGRINMGPLWDWNLSFGNCNGKQGYLPEWWLWPQLDDREYAWFRRLFEDRDFGQRYVDRWTRLRSTVFSTSNVLGRVDAWAGLLSEAQVRNFERWPVLGVAVHPNWYVGDSYEEEIRWMKDWITKRLAWVDRQFVQPPVLAAAGAGKITLNTPAGVIYCTRDGSDPRLPGGSISPKAIRYDGPVAGDAPARIIARVLHDERWSGPLTIPSPASTR